LDPIVNPLEKDTGVEEPVLDDRVSEITRVRSILNRRRTGITVNPERWGTEDYVVNTNEAEPSGADRLPSPKTEEEEVWKSSGYPMRMLDKVMPHFVMDHDKIEHVTVNPIEEEPKFSMKDYTPEMKAKLGKVSRYNPNIMKMMQDYTDFGVRPGNVLTGSRQPYRIAAACVNQRFAYKSLNLKLVAGSMATGHGANLVYHYGRRGAKTYEDFQPSQSNRNHVRLGQALLVEWDVWLEDDRGRIWSSYYPAESVQISYSGRASQYRPKLREGSLIEGKTREELKKLHVHFIAANYLAQVPLLNQTLECELIKDAITSGTVQVFSLESKQKVQGLADE
jgi:hypothetical protein